MSDERPSYCHCTCGLKGCSSKRKLRHGTTWGYGSGCRCKPCAKAAQQAKDRRSKKANDASRDTATKHGQQWTGPELEIAIRKDLTIPQASKMLGRTRAATSNMRHKAANDPKFQRVLGAQT